MKKKGAEYCNYCTVRVAAAGRQVSYLEEAEHDRQDVLGVGAKVFVCWNTVDDFQHQLPQLLKEQTIFESKDSARGV